MVTAPSRRSPTTKRKLATAKSATKKPAARAPDGAVDPYLAQLQVVWGTLTKAYRAFVDRGPLIAVFDVEEGRIYVHPFDAFRADLSPTSQASLDQQWRDAQRRGEQVVFVRDNPARRLVSYSLRIE